MLFKKIGVVLIILGLLGLAGGLVDYSTGEIGVDAKGQHTTKTLSPVSGALLLFVFPVIGVLAFFTGIGFIVVSKKRIKSI